MRDHDLHEHDPKASRRTTPRHRQGAIPGPTGPAYIPVDPRKRAALLRQFAAEHAARQAARGEAVSTPVPTSTTTPSEHRDDPSSMTATSDPTVPTDALSVRRALFLRQFERERREREQDTSTPIRFLSDRHRASASSVPAGEDRGIGGDMASSALPGRDRTESEEPADPVAPASLAALSTTESALPPHVTPLASSDSQTIPTADGPHVGVGTHDTAQRAATTDDAARAHNPQRATPLSHATPSGLAPLIIPSTSRQLDVLRARGDGVPLDPQTLRRMEKNMRVPLGDIRIHIYPAAWTLCQHLGAQAYADGTDIYFQKGAYQPGTPAGRNLLGRQLQRAVAWRTEQQAKETTAASAHSAVTSTTPTTPAVSAQEDAIVQAQATAGVKSDALNPELSGHVHALRGGGQPLGPAVRGHTEDAVGFSSSEVSSHADGEADALNQGVRAVASTTGQDISFRQGVHQPHTAHDPRGHGSGLADTLIAGSPSTAPSVPPYEENHSHIPAPSTPTSVDAVDHGSIHGTAAPSDPKPYVSPNHTAPSHEATPSRSILSDHDASVEPHSVLAHSTPDHPLVAWQTNSGGTHSLHHPSHPAVNHPPAHVAATAAAVHPATGSGQHGRDSAGLTEPPLSAAGPMPGTVSHDTAGTHHVPVMPDLHTAEAAHVAPDHDMMVHHEVAHTLGAHASQHESRDDGAGPETSALEASTAQALARAAQHIVSAAATEKQVVSHAAQTQRHVAVAETEAQAQAITATTQTTLHALDAAITSKKAAVAHSVHTAHTAVMQRSHSQQEAARGDGAAALAALHKEVEAKRTEIHAASDELVTQMEQAGQTEAHRATAETAASVSRVNALATQQSGRPWGDASVQAAVQQAVSGEAAKIIGRLQSGGQRIAHDAQDAAEKAAHSIRQAAHQLVAGMDKNARQVEKAIHESTTATIRRIATQGNEQAESLQALQAQVIASLDKQKAAATHGIMQASHAAVATVHRAGQSAAAHIDHSAAAATSQLDQTAHVAVSHLHASPSAIYAPSDVQQVTQGVIGVLHQISARESAALAEQATAVQRQLTQVKTEFSGHLHGAEQKSIAAAAHVASSVESGLAQAQAATAHRFEQARTEGRAASHGALEHFSAGLTQHIGAATRQWARDQQKTQAHIRDKVDGGLKSQADAVHQAEADLANVAQKAAANANNILGGFLQGVWSFAQGMALVLLATVAIFAVAAFLGFAVFSIGGFLAVAGIVGIALLAVALVMNIVKRWQQSQDPHTKSQPWFLNVLRVTGVALADTVGVSSIYAGATGRDLLTQQQNLALTPSERASEATQGVLTLFSLFVARRPLFKGARDIGIGIRAGAKAVRDNGVSGAVRAGVSGLRGKYATAVRPSTIINSARTGLQIRQVGALAGVWSAIRDTTRAIGDRLPWSEQSRINHAIQVASTSSDREISEPAAVARFLQSQGYRITEFNRSVYDPVTHDTITDIDVGTPETIIEVTVRKQGKLGQVSKKVTDTRINPTGRHVILFSREYSQLADKQFAQKGVTIVRSEADLLSVMQHRTSAKH